MIVGGRDEFLDRPAAALLAAFEANAPRTRSFTATVVRGANHSFVGHERALAEGIVRWIAREAR